MILRERHLFEKRLSSPPPIFQKLLCGIIFIGNDKNNSALVTGVLLLPGENNVVDEAALRCICNVDVHRHLFSIFGVGEYRLSLIPLVA